MIKEYELVYSPLLKESIGKYKCNIDEKWANK